ncbi:MAG: hypothetical protein GY822_06195 [Deltaproteobacteria bacterium]|nr:hypothetical protein [Deltaproteobacteria bacterium]
MNEQTSKPKIDDEDLDELENDTLEMDFDQVRDVLRRGLQDKRALREEQKQSTEDPA